MILVPTLQPCFTIFLGGVLLPNDHVYQNDNYGGFLKRFSNNFKSNLRLKLNAFSNAHNFTLLIAPIGVLGQTSIKSKYLSLPGETRVRRENLKYLFNGQFI